MSPRDRSASDGPRRARASGFPRKLRAWLAAAKADYEAGVDTTRPRNARQLAKWLTSQGEAATDNAVRAWTRGDWLPEARFVGLLERLLVAPWCYLDDRRTPWPPSAEDRRAFRGAIRRGT